MAAASDLPAPSAADRWLDRGLILGFLALAFLLGLFPLKDTDFWWHLKAGDLIRQTGQVPRVDTFTFGAAGHRWVDLHWLFQVLISFGYAAWGVAGLTLAKCAITTGAVAILVGASRREWPVWALLLAWLPGLLVLSGRMYIRPETISLLYMAIVLAVVARWHDRPRLALWLPVVLLLWVNTHGLFVLGLILIAFGLIDAGVRAGAWSRNRRKWWAVVGGSAVASGLACLVNPYGLTGALYPLQLAGTMNNQLFRDSIAELEPLPKLIGTLGLDSLMLNLHLTLMALGVLSFVVPLAWGRRGSWRPSMFRLLACGAFTLLGIGASRNSHQFAAVVGTVTAWNFAEWTARVQERRRGRSERGHPRRFGLQLMVGGLILALIAAVGSGRFYAWAGEGRTVGWGEEPHWFPHAAVEAAGAAEMPDRVVAYHNGHPSLYEYRWAPAKTAYTDARLEVMGPDLYRRYMHLESEIMSDSGAWRQTLAGLGRPAILADTIQEPNWPLAATLMLRSSGYRCVHFDPVAAVFAPNPTRLGIDFAAVHFGHAADRVVEDPAGFAALAKAYRGVGTHVRMRPGGDATAQVLLLVGLDHARKLRAVDPNHVDGWKQAGLIEYFRSVMPGAPPSPRFRLPFDPVFDLPAARQTYWLRRALALAPDDGYVQRYLSTMFLDRQMTEAALPLLERFARQPNRNLQQRGEKVKATLEAAQARRLLGVMPDAADPESFDAHYLLASLELDAGNAPEAVAAADRAIQVARTDHARTAAREIRAIATPTGR